MNKDQYIKLLEVSSENLQEELGTRGFSSLLPVQIRSVDVDNRLVRFIASDETVDRYSTIISVAGWELKAFKTNPIFLAWHDYYGPAAVAGRVVGIEKDLEKKQLLADVLFIEREINPVADMIFQMYAHNPPFLNAVSVGFIPFKAEEISDEEQGEMKGKRKARMRFTSQELLEISAVAVPANPSALVDKALQYGVDPVLVMSAKSMMPEIGDQDEIASLAIRLSGWMCKNGICWPIDKKSTEQMSVRKLFPFTVPPEKIKIIENKLSETKTCTCQANAEHAEDRAGAVLNRKNKGALKQAQELIQTVLDSAEPADESEEKSIEVPGVLLQSEEPEWVKELKASLATVSESLDNYGRDILAALDEINEDRIVGSKSKSDEDEDEEKDDPPAEPEEEEQSKKLSGSSKIAELLSKIQPAKTDDTKKIADVKESAAAMVAIGRDILAKLDKPKT